MKFIKSLDKEWKNLMFNMAFALATIILTILLKEKIILLTLVLIIVTLIGMFKWKSWVTFVLFVFGALFGTFAEVISIKYGVWNYAFPSFWGVPLWLFIVWGNAAAFLYQSGLEIKKLGVKK